MWDIWLTSFLVSLFTSCAAGDRTMGSPVIGLETDTVNLSLVSVNQVFIVKGV